MEPPTFHHSATTEEGIRVGYIRIDGAYCLAWDKHSEPNPLGLEFLWGTIPTEIIAKDGEADLFNLFHFVEYTEELDRYIKELADLLIAIRFGRPKLRQLSFGFEFPLGRSA